MLSKNKIKFIHSLKIKKYRDIHSLFIAEGIKTFEELTAGGMKPVFVSATADFFRTREFDKSTEIVEITREELQKISLQVTPSDVLALFEIPKILFDFDTLGSQLSLFLDDVQNPGNLGTIIRTAEWFGIGTIFCTRETADVYNPKVVQATMGGIARVNVVYVDADAFFAETEIRNIPVFGAFLDGENIYTAELNPTGIIVLGNEGNGISAKTEKHITKRIFIPPFPENAESVESLNVAVAGAIICSEFRRKTSIL
jgi:TrmH family RNA methyltransferase